SLQMRMGILLAVLFAIVYAVISMVGAAMGIGNFYFYLILSLGIMWIQYMVGPSIVEWTMGVRYVTEQEEPELHTMVRDLAGQAGIPVPRIGISQTNLPNAFAFGRGASDGRVCVTQGILKLLDREELRAVLGHELSHLKNRDVLTITVLSVIPMILYRLAWHLLWFGGGSRRRDSEVGPSLALIGLAAFIFYFITNLLVLYASRIREYFADRGSIALGNSPSALASALYKLVYGAARMDKEELKDVEGIKAFFVNDPSQAMNEFRDLKALDLDRNGNIDASELEALRHKAVRLSVGDHLLEILSTHPNMLKRISELSKKA
ncbi:MAG: zinc metalloprotease HtpX, partial [Candidatus Omnitrophota bacterium]